MLFNSLQFALFLPVVLWLFFSLPQRYRQHLLLVASYYFYLSWKIEYGLLLLASTFVDYYVALRIQNQHQSPRAKLYLLASLAINLGFLFTFKYLNFATNSFNLLLQEWGMQSIGTNDSILLPIGISFYTFQSLSYTIDVYRGEIKAEQNFVSFALFVSFFPQLVAGPIERFAALRPQFDKHVVFDTHRIAYGLKLMFWGFFQKMVIADNMAPFANAVYSNPQAYNGFSIVLGTFFFAFQIYCDFAGYTDIARGTAKLIGVDLTPNFQRPYFSYSFIDFWRRWHITLFSWFRNYIYFSLGGSRGGEWLKLRNIFIVFVISGIWHGAAWHFIAWGVLNGSIYLAETYFNQRFGLSHLEQKKLYSPERFLRTITVFLLVNITWVFFRVDALRHIPIIWEQLIHNFGNRPAFGNAGIATNFVLISILMIAHWFDRDSKLIDRLVDLPAPIRWVIYIIMPLLFLGLANMGEQEFIYFQF